MAATALGACHKSEQQNAEANMALDQGMPTAIPANADVEALPADESSVTPSNQLQNGMDAAEANEATANAD